MLQWANRVVGGIDDPRFLLVGPELSPNRSFEDDLTGVSETGTSVIAREFDTSTPFGDYVLTVEDDNAAAYEYGEITIDTGAAIAGLRFVISFYARNDEESGDQIALFNLPALTDVHDKHVTLDQEWRQVIHEIQCAAGDTGNSLVYRITPHAYSAGVAGVGKIRVDNFRIRRVYDFFELPLPSRGNHHQTFSKVYQAQNELADGSEKNYFKGMGYAYDAQYEVLSAAHETYRVKLMNTRYDILFFPHKDAEIAWFVRWDKEYAQDWADGLAPLGHEGNINLVGTELVPYAPDLIIDELTVYAMPDDLLVGGDEEYILES